MSDDLVKRLRDGCSCNIDSSPCMAEEECRDAYAAADRIEALEAKLAKSVGALAGLIDHTHDCEKELTEELHHTDFCGESIPLTNARTTLAELTGGKDD